VSRAEHARAAHPGILSPTRSRWGCGQSGDKIVRARNGNISVTAGTENGNFDFSYLNDRSGPNGIGYGVDYINLGGRDRAVGTKFDDSFTLSSGVELIEGGEGNDTVNYNRSTAGVKVDLNVIVQHGGYAEGDNLVGIENVTGSNHKDVLTGNAGKNVLMGMDGNDTMSGGGGDDRLDGGNNDDTLDGGTGNDTLLGGFGNDRLIAGSGNNVLDGGKGIDTADYSTSSYAVSVSLDEGEGNELRNFAGDMLELVIDPATLVAHDQLADIENLTGSRFTDVLQGDNSANTIHGLDGNDHIYGRGGDDIERGGDGNDTLGTMIINNVPFFGTVAADDAGSDRLFGESGDDVLVGGSGADRMDGGADTDTVDYTWSPSAVGINLATGVGFGASDSWAAGDTYVSIEHVIGSQYQDMILGSVNNEVIDGGGDNDWLHGNSGNDILDGGDGADQIEGGDDDDIMTGGAGEDTFIFRAAPNAAMFSPEAGDGHDTITDFNIAEDRLVFQTNGFIGMLQDGANTVITYADGTASVILENVNLTELHYSDAVVFA
jgi:Ca2+-binding RTX toxin-like protein